MSFSRAGQGAATGQDANICSICLEPMKDSQGLKRLHEEVSVSHVFHQACVDTWLKDHNDCPFCKRVVIQRARPLAHREERVENVFHRNDFSQLFQLGQSTYFARGLNNG